MKHVFLIIFLFLSLSAFADETIGCLRYSFNGSEATVVGYDSNTLKENLEIPETISYNGLEFKVVKISSEAFSGCKTIKTLRANSIKEIIGGGDYYAHVSNYGAFCNCSNLQQVYLPHVVTIGGCAFRNCNNLKFVDFGCDLKTIGCMAFYSCSSLTYLVFPATLEKINIPANATCQAFSGCTLIRDIVYLGTVVPVYINFNASDDTYRKYTREDLVEWSTCSFTYNGKVPTTTYANRAPAGFQIMECHTNNISNNHVGTYTDYIYTKFTNDDMTFDVEIPYTYTINPAKLTAKVKDSSRLYGDGNPQFSSEYSGFVNNEDASVVTSNGSYTTTATVKSDVGTYAIKQSGATAQNYVFEYEDGTLTVNKAPLTMTANDKTMTYGNNIPVFDISYEGLKNNETQPAWVTKPTLSSTVTATSNVGTYPITISNAEAKNYQLTVNSGTMTIEKAELTVRADSKSKVYGDENPEFTLTYNGLKNNESVPEWEKRPTVETTASAKSPVGTYPISVKDAVAKNYNITAVDGKLTVNKAQLQIKPNNATRKYGADNPKFTLSYLGLKNNENVPEWTIEPVITTNAIKTSSVGDYAIQVTTAEARNYTLEKKTGTLTITKAPLKVGVNNYSRKYGETNPTFELHYDGLQNGETAPQWTTWPTITTEANAKSDVGEYVIKGTGGVMANYEATEIAPGQLTITPASLTLKANDVSRLYFEDNPELTYSSTGFMGNDDASVLTTQPQIKTSATKKSGAGVYAIEIGGATSKNYMISYEKGALTINKRQLTVSTKDYTRAYGEENPEFELTYKGFVNNENENVLLSKPKAITEATPTTDVGEYDITIDNGVAENYYFNYIGGKLTVEKAYQTLTWDQEFSDIKQYDQVELLAKASSGLEITYTIEGDEICSIVKIGKKQYLDCTGEGEVVIIAIQEGNKNYWQSTKKYKPIVIQSSSGIEDLALDGDKDTKIYDVASNRVGELKKGINIIKMSNGTTKKVMVK